MKRLKIFVIGLWMMLLKVNGHIPSHFLRRIGYMCLGFRFPRSTTVYSGQEIRKPNNIEIAENTIIGHSCILDGRQGISIGNNVNLSTGVWIWTLQHDPQDPFFGTKGGQVVVEDYVWLSCRTVILPGVKVGEGAVVAAGAVVSKDVEPWSIVGGIPAKKIGERNKNMKYKLGADGIPFI